MRLLGVGMVAMLGCAGTVEPPHKSSDGTIICVRRSTQPLKSLGAGAVLTIAGVVVLGYGLLGVAHDTGDGDSWITSGLGAVLMTGGVASFLAASRGQDAIDACEHLASQAAMQEKALQDLANAAVTAAHLGDCAKAAVIDTNLIELGSAAWIDGYRDDPDVVKCLPRATRGFAPP